MILAVDIGNSNIVIGGIEQDQILFEARLRTDATKTSDEYCIDVKMILEVYHVDASAVEGAIISSVVPQVLNSIKTAITKLTGKTALVVGTGLKTGLNIKIENHAQTGADLVVDSVAALREHKAPIIVIDMGTATTLSVLDREGAYVGTIILPGARISLDSLVSGTAQLPKIGLTVPRQIIGTNTVDCMRSGILYGSAACLDGMIDRIWEELGYETAVIATGGLAHAVVPHCFHEITVNDTLLLHGLRLIYEKNKKVRTEGGTS